MKRDRGPVIKSAFCLSDLEVAAVDFNSSGLQSSTLRQVTLIPKLIAVIFLEVTAVLLLTYSNNGVSLHLSEWEA